MKLAIPQFFDDVLVMDEDTAVRHKRLADLSELEVFGPGEK